MRDSIEHEVKVWPDWYEPSREGLKPWELRKFDRDYRVGDTLFMREYRPAREGFPGNYTGRWMRRKITLILMGGQFGLEPGHAILSLGPIEEERQ